MTSSRLSHKLLGNFSATFEIFGNFLEFSATLDFLRFFEATFFTRRVQRKKLNDIHQEKGHEITALTWKPKNKQMYHGGFSSIR